MEVDPVDVGFDLHVPVEYQSARRELALAGRPTLCISQCLASLGAGFDTVPLERGANRRFSWVGKNGRSVVGEGHENVYDFTPAIPERPTKIS
jgi:hypothetical protein